MIYVITNTHWQFENFCKEQHVSPVNNRFRFIPTDKALDKLRGIPSPNVILYGLWFESRNANMILAFIESRQFV